MKASLTASAAKRIAAIFDELGEGALRLAYHAAVPVVVDATLLNLLRVNFFSDTPDSLPYEAEADLLLSPLFREIGNGLFEIEPNVRNLLLTGLRSRYGEKWIHKVALLLEQYTDATLTWRSLPELERAQQLTAVSILDPARAELWLDTNAIESTDDLDREWFVAMRRRIADQSNVTTAGGEISRTVERLRSRNIKARVEAIRALDGLSCLPETDPMQIVAALCEFIMTRARSPEENVQQDVQAALSLLGNLQHDGFKFADIALIGANLADLNFSGVQFTNVILRDVYATGLNLTGAIFRNVIMTNTVMESALLDDANLQFLELSQVSFANASLVGATLDARDAEDVNLEDADTRNSNILLSDASSEVTKNATSDGSPVAEVGKDGGVHDSGKLVLASDEAHFDVSELLSRARSLEENEDWEGARSAYREIIDAYGELTDPEAFVGVGRADWRLGVLDSAQEWYEQALRHFRQVGDRGKQAELLMNLGNLSEETEHLDDAINQFDEARVIFVQSNDFHNAGLAEVSLGRVTVKTALPDQAADHYQRALNFFTEISATTDVIEVLSVLTGIMTKLERYAEAATYAARAAQLCRGSGYDATEIGFLKELVEIYRIQGDLPASISACEQALWASTQIQGMDSPDTLVIASDLAQLWRQNDNPLRAQIFDEITFDRRRLVLGEDHSDTLASALRLIDDLYELGDNERAREMAVDLLGRYREVLGDDHETTRALAAELAVDLKTEPRVEDGHSDYTTDVLPAIPLVPDYLGSVFDASGSLLGGCFQAAPGVLVAALDELDGTRSAVSGAIVRVEAIVGGDWFDARVARLDQDRKLAILIANITVADPSNISMHILSQWISRFTTASSMRQGEAVSVIGIEQHPDNPGSHHAAQVISAEWVGQSIRANRIPLGVIFCRQGLPIISGTPVIRDSDGTVAGVTLKNFNSSSNDSHIVFAARSEDVVELLRGIADVTLAGFL